MPAAAFEHLDHTADVGLRLVAPTAADLFLAAAEGLHALWGLPTPRAATAPGPLERAEVDGPDTEALLVAWLNELIFQATVGGRTVGTMHGPRLAAGRFSADVEWQPVDWEVCVDGIEVKAATYHGLRVAETADGVTATVIFDV